MKHGDTRWYDVASMPFASYAVDIGVYNVGARGQILTSTKTAWARSSEGTGSFDDITYSGLCDEGTFVKFTQRWSCGRSISRLVDRIAADLDAGFFVSLGLEAPMWFPIGLGLEQCANIQLFKPRCEEERGGSEWYLQSGAAATVKAISIAAMLVGLLTSKHPGVKLTTDPSSRTIGTITLYEAFVVGEGKFKMPLPAGATQAENEWDAFTASLAWGAVNRAFNIPPSVHPKELHKPGSSISGIASVWQIVASLVHSNLRVGGPLDCQIVGLTTLET
jgi:hypothetical protein